MSVLPLTNGAGRRQVCQSEALNVSMARIAGWFRGRNASKLRPADFLEKQVLPGATTPFVCDDCTPFSPFFGFPRNMSLWCGVMR